MKAQYVISAICLLSFFAGIALGFHGKEIAGLVMVIVGISLSLISGFFFDNSANKQKP